MSGSKLMKRAALPLLVVLALVATACGGEEDPEVAADTSAPETTSEDAETDDTGAEEVTDEATPEDVVIKVGLLAPYSGVFGFYGSAFEASMNIRFAEAIAAGAEIELVTEDDQTDPQTALALARKLVEEDGVDVVVCCVNGAASLAVAQYLDSVDTPMIAPIPGPKGLEAFDKAFSVGFHPAQLAVPFGRYAYEELGHETAVLFASDFVQGRLVADGFAQGFTEAGGEILGGVYPPLDTADYGSFLAQIPDADMVLSFFGGADAIRVVQQFDSAGLKDETQLIGLGPLVSKLVLGQMGDAALGVQAFFHYAEDEVDTPGNEAFLAAAEGKLPDTPPRNFVQANGYATASVIVAAAEAAGADADAEALVEALRNVEVDAPWGDLAFDPETHYALIDGYHYEVAQGEGGLVHRILGQFEGDAP